MFGLRLNRLYRMFCSLRCVNFEFLLLGVVKLWFVFISEVFRLLEVIWMCIDIDFLWVNFSVLLIVIEN